MIYFTSDWHLWHNKQFVWEPRGFSSVEEMNQAIIDRYNEVVKADDLVYVLGDLLLGGSGHLEEGVKTIDSLPGRKIVIAGNHDTDKRIEAYRSIGLPVVFATRIKCMGFHFYLSHYPTITSNLDDDKRPSKRMWNICGHSHTTNPLLEIEKGIPAYHVEVDAHNCYPVPITKIIEDLTH